MRLYLFDEVVAMGKIEAFFERLSTLLFRYESLAYQLDQDPELLGQAYEDLVEIGGLHLLIPESCGGLGGERHEWIRYNIEMAGCSGALLFLQAQHQFTVDILNRLLPDERVSQLFSQLAQDQEGVGIAVSSSRKNLSAKRRSDGWELSGELPWVTGYGFLNKILIAFCVNDQDYFGFFSLDQAESVSASPVKITAIYNSTQTVGVTLNRYFIADEDIVAIRKKGPDVMREHPTLYNFTGAAKALLKLSKQGKHFNSDQAVMRHRQLESAWQDFYQEVLNGPAENPYALRAKALLLAEECALFARLMYGASGVLEAAPVMRLSREIWQYAVAGINEGQIGAYLAEWR